MSASPFVADWVPLLAPRESGREPRALDLAMGIGRHTLLLARSGFRTFGVDANFDAIHAAVDAARLQKVSVTAWCADLTAYPLPEAAFDLVLVTRYLQRDLFPALRDAVRPGGFIVYETFTVLQRALGVGPTSPDHLLEPGELVSQFDAWDVLFSEEVAAPEAVARVVARKPARSSSRS